MQARELQPGEIVQIDPNYPADPAFAGCLLVVTDSKSWGVVGYIAAVEPGAIIFYRVGYAHIAPTGGRVHWPLDITPWDDMAAGYNSVGN